MKPALLLLATILAAPLSAAEPPEQPDFDQCRAAELQSFIGERLEDLPPLPPGVVRREVPEGGMMTMDYRLDRQTIIHHETEKTIQTISCG